MIPQLSYILANSYIQKRQAEQIDVRIRRVINNFVKGQSLQNAYIHATLKNGGLEIPQIEKEMHAYRIHRIAHLLQTTEGKKILKEYTQLSKNKVHQYLSLSTLLEVSLKNLALELVDWNQFKENPIDFIESREQVFTFPEE
jgi:hypothetical protein